jgi:hypothetical protein
VKVITLSLATLLLAAATAAAQDATPSNETTYKIAIQRSREATVKCENDLASIWSQAETLNKAYQEKIQEFDKMKRDYDNIKKQLEEKSDVDKKAE